MLDHAAQSTERRYTAGGAHLAWLWWVDNSSPFEARTEAMTYKRSVTGFVVDAGDILPHDEEEKQLK
jgi:hypothetical protein